MNKVCLFLHLSVIRGQSFLEKTGHMNPDAFYVSKKKRNSWED